MSRKYKTLNLKEKAEILSEVVKENKRKNWLLKNKNIPDSTLSTFSRNEEKIMSESSSQSNLKNGWDRTNILSKLNDQ